jgi:hypothetical protein
MTVQRIKTGCLGIDDDFTHIKFFVIFHAASVSQHGHDNAFL